MYKVSKQYLERIYSGGAKSKAKIKFNGVELEDANRLIEKITIKRRILANGSERFSLDNFIATEIEMILHNVSLDTIKEPVDISIGTLVGDTYEYVPIGIFKIEGSPTTDKDKTTLQLRDNAIKFDFNYNAQPVIDNNGGSATLKQIFNNICELAEVETDVTSFNGEDLKFGIFDNTITARQYISYIAEQAGMMATIDRTGKLTFVDLNSDSAQIVSGKTVTFDSELERSMSFQVNGSTEQSTYDGKNKFNYITALVSSNYGLTNKINADGSITTTGKPTRDYASIVSGYNITDELEDGETYTLSQAIASDKVYAQINARKSDNTYTYIPLNNKTIKTRAFKVDKTTYASYTIDVQTTTMAVWGDSSLTITNKYMLCKGTDNASTSFQPYVGGQPSPNPDFPQEIVNVRGVENIWFGGDSVTVNGVTFTKNDDGSYDITGTATADANCYNFVDIANTKLKNGEAYIISINKLYSSSVNILTEAYAGNTWVRHVMNPIQITTNLTNNKYVTIADNITRIRYGLRVTKGTTVNVKGLKIQLEEGLVSHDYVPNGSNYLKFKNHSYNFWKPYYNQTFQGITLTQNDDGSILLNGTATADIFFKIVLDETINEATTLSCNYKSGTISGASVYIRTRTSKNIINHSIDVGPASTQGIKLEHKTAENHYQEITIQKNAVLSNVLLETMLLKGTYNITELPSYEPYKSESTLIDLKGNKLCSNKDKSVKDNLFVTKNGKTEIFKKIDEYVFTGNETLKFADSNRRIYCSSEIVTKLKNVYIPTPQSSSNITPSFCTHYTVDGQGNVVKGSNKFGFSQWSTTKYIYFPADYDTVGEFKAFLKAQYNAGTPVKVQFQLENPETIELDTVTPLKSYIGQNNISNNADVDMNVTYDLKRQPFEIPIRIVESLEKDETYKIGRVEYEDALRKFEQGEQDDYLYINSANPYISNQKQISDIYELLNGYSIDTFKTGKIIGNPALDGYDLIKFVYKDKEYITLNQGTLTFNGVMIQTNETTIGTEAKQSNVTVKSQAAKFKRAFTEIDAVNAQVKITTEQTNTIQDNLTNNYYTIEQSNTLIQNAQSGLTNTFSEAGGNNIFRNTGLWFSQSDIDNPYEYWTGKNVSKQNTDKSSNGSLMILKKGTLEQEQVVSNGNYTVSFKYKKLIQLATCKVIVNDNEYELTQMTDTEWQTGSKDADGNIVIKPLEVTSNHINVKFTSTVDNAIEIYDLMVNAGTVKLAYSQNENEVTTDTVNISKGITITSSANDTKFKANADGIRIVDKNNEKTILTEFTDKGMSTKEMEVENGATIVKVLVQNVGSQTWFTRI